MKKSSIIFVKIRIYRLTELSYICTLMLIDVFVMKMELLEGISHIPCFSGFAAERLLTFSSLVKCSLSLFCTHCNTSNSVILPMPRQPTVIIRMYSSLCFCKGNMRQTRARWIYKPSIFFFRGLLLSPKPILFCFVTWHIVRHCTRHNMQKLDVRVNFPGFFIDFPCFFIDFQLHDGRTSINYHQCRAFCF